MVSFKKNLYKSFVIALVLLVLVACGSNNDNEPVSEATNENDGVISEDLDETVIEDDDADNNDEIVTENDDEEEDDRPYIEPQEVIVPDSFPEGYPVPDVATEVLTSDGDLGADLNLITNMTFEELEELYDPFYDQYGDDLSKSVSEGDDAEITYTVDIEDFLLTTTITKTGEYQRVHTILDFKIEF